MALDKSKYGWEGISNGGEIYDSQTNMQSDLERNYLNTVEMLALQKLKHEILFESMLNSSIRRLSSLGIEISKEKLMQDIQKEMLMQDIQKEMEMPSIDLDFDYEQSSVSTNTNDDAQNQINGLLNNLGNIFESAPVQQGDSMVKSSLPRESTIQVVDEMINKMVEGTLDVNGNAINSNTPYFDNRKKGFTGMQLLTVTSFIASFIISLIGIIFIFITK